MSVRQGVVYWRGGRCEGEGRGSRKDRVRAGGGGALKGGALLSQVRREGESIDWRRRLVASSQAESGKRPGQMREEDRRTS